MYLIRRLSLSLLYTFRISRLRGGRDRHQFLAACLFGIQFLSLALVKRCAELVSLARNNVEFTRGRDHRITDLSVLWPLFGVGAALSRRLLFGLFITPRKRNALRHTAPAVARSLGSVYWLARLLDQDLPRRDASTTPSSTR